jgi:hypothetical protein
VANDSADFGHDDCEGEPQQQQHKQHFQLAAAEHLSL